MYRRSLLVGGAVVAIGLAGCFEANAGAGDGDDGTALGDSDVETVDTDCLTGELSDPEIEIGEAVVEVTGSIRAPDPCHDAVLADVRIEDGTLVIEVDVAERDEICVQCVGEISYAATVAVDDPDALDDVRVEHADQGAFGVGTDATPEADAEATDPNGHDVDEH